MWSDAPASQDAGNSEIGQAKETAQKAGGVPGFPESLSPPTDYSVICTEYVPQDVI